MIKFVVNEFRNNLKLFLLCFIVLVTLLTSNINLLSVAFSVRNNIYDSLKINVKSSLSNKGFEEFKDCKIKSSSYSLSFSNISSLTNIDESNNYPLVNDTTLPYEYHIEIYDTNNNIVETKENIVGEISVNNITNDLDEKGIKYKVNRNEIECSLFFDKQEGFLKDKNILIKDTKDNIIYLSNTVAEYIGIKDNEEIIIKSKYGEYKYLTKVNNTTKNYLYLSTSSIYNLNKYLEEGYKTNISLLDINQYKELITFISSRFDIDIESLRSPYIEDYITLSNVVIIVLSLIFSFILVLIGFVIVKLINNIISNRLSMICTLSILGVRSKNIYLTYSIILSIFFIFSFMCSIGLNFVLNIFISRAFLLTFNIDYIFYHLAACIILYFLFMLIYCFTSNYFVFNRLKKQNMYTLLKEEKW